MTIGWPSGTIDQAPVPTNLLPGRIEGWPAGTQRAANEAERILSTAVAWWDPTVSGFRDGDRWLRNSGTAGGLLDLRLGSSVVANTNDPLFLAPDATGYVYLAGVAGNAMSIPDEPAFTTTDLDVAVLVQPDSWRVANYLISKGASGSTVSWYLALVSSGVLNFRWSTTGSSGATTSTNSTVAVPSGAQALWVRATLDADRGDGKYEVRFYTADPSPSPSWTQLGDPVVGAATATVFASTSAIRVGDYLSGALPGIGKFYRAIVKNGIDGTTVLDVDCDAITTGSATSFTAATGQTVTINRSTGGRKAVAMPAKRLSGRARFLFGTDDYMEVVDNWQHQLLNFGQSDSFTVLAVVRQPSYSATQTILAKRNPSISPIGYSLRNGTGTPAQGVFDFGDSANILTVTVPARTTGTLFALAVTATANLTSYSNGATGTVVSRGSLTTFANTETFRIGRLSGSSTNYGDLEFTAAAIFRRALTAREISVLSTYYSGG